MRPAVSVCIATTRPTTVGATVRSIDAQTAADWELVVVAQGDAGAIRTAVEGALTDRDRLCFVSLETRGLSRARNSAIRHARGAIVAMIDDDCESDPRWLDELAACFAADPAVGLVGGAVVAPAPVNRGPRNCPSCAPGEVVYDPVAHQRRPPAGWGWIGANFALRREVALRIGEFDQNLGAGARFPVAEEMDYMLRAEALGIRMQSTPRAVVTHTHGWRYGFRAVMGMQRNYARGNGALAAKLTLMDDPRGEAKLAEMRRLALVDWIQRRRLVALPAGVRRLLHYTAAYRECLRDYTVAPTGVLVQRHGVQPQVIGYQR